jgi:hypothetical protein
MERKIVKRLSNVSYWSDGVGLWLKPNIGGDFREKEVSVRDGRRWNRDVGFLDLYFKEAFSDIPEIQFVRKVVPEVIKEEIVEEKRVEPIVEKVVVETVVKAVPSRSGYSKLSEEVVKGIVDDYTSGVGSSRDIAKKWGVSYSIVMRYVRKAGVEYRAVAGRKKAPTS